MISVRYDGLMNMAAPPTLIYDGNCGMCTASATRLQALTGERVRILPSYEAVEEFSEIAAFSLVESVIWVGANGQICRAAEAIFCALAEVAWLELPLFLYRYLPGFRPISETLYRWIADRRQQVGFECAIPPSSRKAG